MIIIGFQIFLENSDFLFLPFFPCKVHLGRIKRIWYLSPMRAAKVQASLRIRAVSPEPSLLAHTSSESRGTFRQKARSLAPLNGWACAVKICHDGMLEDTNSLDGAHFQLQWCCNGQSVTKKCKFLLKPRPCHVEKKSFVCKWSRGFSWISSIFAQPWLLGSTVRGVTCTSEPRHKTNKGTVHPAKTQISRSAWASAQSDQSLRCPHEESLGP